MSVLITGSNRGIGLGLVKRFLQSDRVKYVFAGVRNPDKSQALAEISDHRLTIVKLDVESDASLRSAFTEVNSVLGDSGLDILINNAGLMVNYSTNGDIDRDSFNRCLNVNTTGPVITSQYVGLHRTKSSYSQYNRKNWEDSDSPILCETCLGDNPYLRMMKDKHGKECKICERPSTTFRWQPGKGARYKNTELCQTCAKVKNVCQTCMFDLEYGLPVQVRDHALNIPDNIPKQGASWDFYLQNVERALADGNGTTPAGALALPRSSAGHDMFGILNIYSI